MQRENQSSVAALKEIKLLTISEDLFAGFAEYLVEQFVRRTAVRKSRVVAFKIVRALDPAVFPRHHVLRNIDAERVGAVALLKLDLAFTGEEPVHEKLGSIGMRCFIKEADSAAACAQRAAFLELESLSQRKTLFDRFFAFSGVARNTDGELAGGQPIDWLAVVTGDGHVHLAIEPAHELGAELRMVVKKQYRSVHTVHARIGGDDFPFPLGIEQVPIRRELFWAHQVGIVAQLDDATVADKSKNVLSFGVDVSVFALPPLRLIQNFGQHEERLNRSEDIGGIKRRLSGALAAKEEVH